MMSLESRVADLESRNPGGGCGIIIVFLILTVLVMHETINVNTRRITTLEQRVSELESKSHEK